MRRVTWVVAIIMSLALVLAGCGKKDASAVVKDLDRVINKLDSYQGSGTMVLHTGQQPQEYQVEVWYQNPHYYRIALTNEKKDITQIVLKNDEGVFVLTPHLNKSFRFQSEWPEKQGQVYLFQSLARSILNDNDRQFTTDDKNYVFNVLANYQNGSLARQKIWLDKKNLAPTQVEVLDSNANVMVNVNFAKFEFDKKFDKDSFQMQRNLTGWNIQRLPMLGLGKDAAGLDMSGGKADAGAKQGDAAKATTGADLSGGKPDAGAKQGDAAKATTGADLSGGKPDAGAKQGDAAKAATGAGVSGGKPDAGAKQGDAAKATTGAGVTGGKPDAGAKQGDAAKAATGAGVSGGKPDAGAKQGDAAKATTGAASGAGQQFGVIEPQYLPKGVAQRDVSEIKLGDEKAVMLRYSGKYNYNLVESRPLAQTATSMSADLVDLGFGFGILSGTDMKTLAWTSDGVEFRLSSGDLPITEMIHVAQAVQGQMGK